MILVVEDDVDIREAILEILEDEDIAAEGAANGRDAFEKLQAGVRPDLILLDLMMPGMNGWEFAAALKADATLPTVPIVVISADTQIQEKAEELGAVGYLRKPIQLAALLGIIERFALD